MTNLKKWIADTPIEDYLIPFAVLLLVFSTNNRLILVTKQLCLVLAGAVLFFAAVSRRSQSRPSFVKYTYLAFFFLIAQSFRYTGDRASSIQYVPYLVLAVVIVLFEFDGRFFSCLFGLFSAFFWLFIVSMYMELLAPNLFRSIFSFLSLGGNLVVRSVDGVAIAGIAYEKAYAAFLCNMGLGLIFARLFLRGISPARITQLLIVFAALMMTGKRTLFLVPLVGLVLFALLFSKSHRVATALGIALCLLALLAVAYAFVPQVSLVFDRLTANTSDPLSGREVFWAFAMMMFSSSPLVGRGFLSFNSYVNAQGFLYYGEPWMYQAHNVYIQVLAELGLAGLIVFVLFVTGLIFGLVKATWRWRANRGRVPIFVLAAAYWSILIAIYSLTGNTLYYPCQLIVIALCVMVYQKYGRRGGETLHEASC